MMYKTFAVFILLSIIITISSCGLSEDTVAKVGNQKIRVAEFTDALKKRFPNKENFSEVDSAAKMQVLNRMIDKKRKLAAAYDMDIDDDEKLKETVKSQKEKAMFSKYYERMVVDSVIDLSKVEDYLENIKEEVNASHILIKYKGTSGTPQGRIKEEAAKLAKSLVERIRDGESINTLAKEYSEDPSASKNNGNLGYFTWGRMVNEFQEAAFNLEPGEVSEPVLTKYGYHIIQVEDRRANPKYDPDNIAAATYQIKSKLFSEDRSKAMKRWSDHGEELRKQHNFTIMDENVANLVAVTNEKKETKQVQESDYTEEEKELVLAEYNGGKITLGDLLDIYQKKFRALLPKLYDPLKLNVEIKNAASVAIVHIITERDNYDQEPQIQKIITETLEQQMISLLDKKVMENVFEIPDDELLGYYEEHPDQYKKEAELEIWEIYIKDEKTAKKVAQLAKSGQDFEQLAKKYNEDKSTKKKKGYLGFRAQKRRGAVSKKAFEIGPEQISGPVEYRRGWAVIKTGEIKPEGTKSFEEVKNLIKRRLKSEKNKQRREEWDQEINEKYQAKINYEIVDSI